MSTATTDNKITLLQATLRACFLLMAIVFLAGGILPQYLNYFEEGKIELAENAGDKEAEEKEGNEENEKDDYLSELLVNTFWYSEEMQAFDRNFYHWHRSYIDILTPPPKHV